MKVLVTDKFSAEGLRVFEEAGGIQLDYQPGLSDADLLAAVADADALVIRGGTQVSAEVFAAAQRLRVVGRAGIGMENVDLNAANHRGVVVMNTPFGSATTSAEHTLSMLMALARQIPQADRHVRGGEWRQEAFLGVEICGKTLGVIGAGKIGKLVVERALGLKMRVLVNDPYLTDEAIRQMGAEPVDFDTLLARADFITLHLPRNGETENLLDGKALRRVKPGVRIINCAQGGLIDETALAAAITSGRVAGAALDVFDKEPPAPDHPLLGLPQVIITPHLRTSTVDAQTNVAVQIACQIVSFLQHGVIENAINVPSVSAEVLESMRPYLELAEKLGAFQAQINARGLETVTVRYAGGVAEVPIEPLTVAVLKGLLTPMLGDMVNFVNAPVLARERGIRVVETRTRTPEGYANLIHLAVRTTEGEHSVSGALFGEQDVRIVRIDGYQVEAIPSGDILVIHNQDRPGVIGFLGQVLGEAQVNIAMMNLSRRKIQGNALSLITVDHKVPDEVLGRLRANAHILSVEQVHL